MRFLFRLIVLVFAAAALVAAGLWYVASRGVSARTEPTRLEEALAVKLRTLAIPSSARSMANAVPDSAGTIAEALEHYADHCAMCHGNDGRGQTDLGRGLYPKPPDLRQSRTQSLSDGELFYIIQNGVRFTGMPAFSDTHTTEDSWELVRFIRHLPSLTPAELERLDRLHPAGPAEREEEPHRHHGSS